MDANKCRAARGRNVDHAETGKVAIFGTERGYHLLPAGVVFRNNSCTGDRFILVRDHNTIDRPEWSW